MVLKLQLDELVSQPAVLASPAGPPVPFNLVFEKTDASPKAFVTSVLGVGVPRVTSYSKMEAIAIGNWLLDFANGVFD